jgi:hypothetical protein
MFVINEELTITWKHYVNVFIYSKGLEYKYDYIIYQFGIL